MSAGEIRYRGTIDTSDFDRGTSDMERQAHATGGEIERGFENRVRNLQPAFRRMAAIGTASFAAISYGVNRSVTAAGDAETASRNLESTFGDSSANMIDWIQDFGNEFAFAETELI